MHNYYIVRAFTLHEMYLQLARTIFYFLSLCKFYVFFFAEKKDPFLSSFSINDLLYYDLCSKPVVFMHPETKGAKAT